MVLGSQRDEEEFEVGNGGRGERGGRRTLA